jgi:methylmalonyl-CoA mutase N-terminal domain/subunit
MAEEESAAPQSHVHDRYSSEGEQPDGLATIRDAVRAWREGPLAATEKKLAPRAKKFTTWSGLEVPDVLTPAEVNIDYTRDLGMPGVYPFTRGVQPNMYRGRLWTMRQFAGFGTPEQTNERFRYLLGQGQTGLSTAFDFPTLMG